MITATQTEKVTSNEEIRVILENHAKWLIGDRTGSRADLRGADLRGADLRFADLRGADLRGADLRGADLRDADLRDADLESADLESADLRDADLRDADLSFANLRDANLRDANLGGANLRDAKMNFVPLIENIDEKILVACSAEGCSLEMGVWHTCETTHCRAGWAVYLAGDAGRALEIRLGTAAAGALLHARSRPDLPIPDFYASNDDALADMRQRAKQ